MSSIMKIKKKIQSIETTEKITRTMKLVATSNLKKDQKFFNDFKEYNNEFYNLYSIFINEIQNKNPEEIEEKKILWIIFTSTLGLCGAYNINIIKELENNFNKSKDQILLFGRKGYSLLKNKDMDKYIKYYINANSNDISYEFCSILSNQIISDIKNNEYTDVKIIYNKFINSIEFIPSILNMHPFDKKVFKNDEKKINGFMTFETNPELFIDILEKQFFSILIFSCIIETKVSENSSRRNAMDSASNNAKEIREKYLIDYNNKRQAKITQEINEIIGGFDATK